jgi:cytochrome P450
MLDPIPAVWTDDPHPIYRVLREEHPVHYIEERDLWVLSRYDDIRAAVRDPRTWSSAQGVVPSGFIPENPTLIVMDDPEHTTMRHAVSRAFTPRRIDALAPRILELARDLVDTFPAQGELDAFEAFTDPLPLLVMAELLGVDPDQREMFKRCGDAIVYASDNSPEVIRSAEAELTRYLSEVFAERRREPREDLISVLLHESPEGAALGERDLLGLCFLLLVAGTETTTSALGNALLLLDEYPEARRRLVEDPKLLPGACDEVLRFDSPVQGLSRVAACDVELHGRTIPKGARVHMLYAAANRDPRAFPEPEHFDIERRDNHHLGFGFGVHFCLGASLARLELRIGIEEFLRRAPGYRVRREGVERMRSDTNRGFRRLPVSL